MQIKNCKKKKMVQQNLSLYTVIITVHASILSFVIKISDSEKLHECSWRHITGADDG